MHHRIQGGWRFHRRTSRGQSLVEFALVLPLLMVLLLGIADFGRVFAAGIMEEAAVRDSAEAAAQEYLQLLGNQAALDPTNYQPLHDRTFEVACREAEQMPGRVVDGSGKCTMPIIAVCVHDAAAGDPNCGEGKPAPGGPCYRMDAAWNPAKSALTERPYVEVRMCYRFDPLFTFALGSWGSIWLQKANNFTVTNYSAP